MGLWVTGSVQSGKTTALIAQLEQWSHYFAAQQISGAQTDSGAVARGRMILVFAANADNRSILSRRVAEQLKGRGSIKSTTPLAFFEAEVQLFWPLVIQQLDLRGYFPYRLRPETEQALALRLWGEDLIKRFQQLDGASLDRWVRRVLDLIQLAASSGTPFTDLAARLKTGTADLKLLPEPLADDVQQMALQWRDWCLPRGVLTYGLITDLFWQYVLPHPVYRSQIPQRFAAIAADDVENYPAIARSFFETALDLGLPSIFTYSELGGIRDGLGADAAYLLGLRQRCTEIVLPSSAGLAEAARGSIADMPLALQQASAQHQQFYALKTTARFELLQAVAQQVADSIHGGEILPHEVAILGPGLDPLARYGIIETLQRSGIAVESLRDQRPIQSTAMVRSLLTLLALVYPGLGHLLDTEQIAEMLVALSGVRSSSHGPEGNGAIDPVRAGLLADYCFRPHPDRPELLPLEVYSRWDRLGHSTAKAYETLRQWIAQQQGDLKGGGGARDPAQGYSAAYLTLNPVFVLDRAIQTFLMPRPLTVDRLAVLRELIETAQHYWEVDARLRKMEQTWPTLSETVSSFIQLLQRGVVTANPYPTTLAQQARSSVILATTFQYLNARLNHRWQFWLDAGSQLWQYSGDLELWGAPLFLNANLEKLPAPVERAQDPNALLRNTLLNVLGRVQNRVYLCHSELAINGQPQMGPLMPWIDLALPLETPLPL